MAIEHGTARHARQGSSRGNYEHFQIFYIPYCHTHPKELETKHLDQQGTYLDMYCYLLVFRFTLPSPDAHPMHGMDMPMERTTIYTTAHLPLDFKNNQRRKCSRHKPCRVIHPLLHYTRRGNILPVILLYLHVPAYSQTEHCTTRCIKNLFKRISHTIEHSSRRMG